MVTSNETSPLAVSLPNASNGTVAEPPTSILPSAFTDNNWSLLPVGSGHLSAALNESVAEPFRLRL